MISDKQRIEAARVAAVCGGCTCKPDITLHDIGGGMVLAGVAHDADCKHRVDSGTTDDLANSLRAAMKASP